MMDIVLSTLYIFAHLILAVILWDSCHYCPHFTEGKLKPKVFFVCLFFNLTEGHTVKGGGQNLNLGRTFVIM